MFGHALGLNSGMQGACTAEQSIHPLAFTGALEFTEDGCTMSGLAIGLGVATNLPTSRQPTSQVEWALIPLRSRRWRRRALHVFARLLGFLPRHRRSLVFPKGEV